MAKRPARLPQAIASCWILILAVDTLAADGPRRLAGEDARIFGEHEKEIATLRGAGDYPRALELAGKAHALCVAKLGEDAPQSTGARRIVDTLRAIADMPAEARAELAEADRIDGEINQLFYAGKYPEAQKLRERQVATRRRHLGGEHLELAESLNKLAIVLMVQAKSDEAMKAGREALAISEKSAGKEDETTGGCLNTLGNLAQNGGDVVAAQALYERALAIVRKTKGESEDLAAALGNLGTLHQAKGELWTAEPLIREALELHRRLSGDGDRRTAVALNNLAALLDTRGDYQAAEPLYRQALAVLEKTSGPTHPSVAVALNNLAQLVRKKGDPGGAEPLYRRALEIVRGRFGDEHPGVSLVGRNLACTLRERGDLGDAEALHRRSLAVRRKLLRGAHPDVAESLSDLGTLLIEMGQAGEAVPLLEESIAILEPKRGEHPLELASAKATLARLRIVQRAFSQAESLCREVLDLRRKHWGPEHPVVAADLCNLAFVLALEERNSEAESHYRQVLALEAKILGKDHPARSSGLLHLANLLARSSDGPSGGEIEALYEEAGELRRKSGEAGLHVACADYGEFLLHHARRPEAAAARFAEAAAQLEELRTKVGGDELDRAQYFSRLSRLDPFGGLARAYLAGAPAPQGLGSGRQPRAVAAFDAVERGRGRALLDLLDRGRHADPVEVTMERLRASGKNAAAERLEDARRREIEAGAARISAERQLESLRRERGVSAEEKATIEQRLRGERARARDAERQAARDALEVARSELSSAGLRPRDAKAAISALGPAERMLVYDVGVRDSLVFVVAGAKARDTDNGDGIDAVRALKLRWPDGAEVDSASLGAAVNRVTADRATTAKETPEGSEPAGRGESELFAALVPAEILRELESVDRVLVVADGPLHYLPFEALLVDRGRRDRWLDRLPPVVYGASAALFAERREKSARRRSSPAASGRTLFVGLGDPDFARAGTTKNDSPAYLAWTRLRGGFGELPRLPGTRVEVEAIAELSRARAGAKSGATKGAADVVRVLLGDEATVARLWEAAAAPRYVHLATHGLVEGDRKVYESALAMTAPVEPAAGDNGFLTLGDLLGRWGGRLEGTELVTLSACRSAQGKTAAGEGFLALTWGFLFAGAESVAASLWKVDDAATALLMVRFYENLLGSFKEARQLGGRVYPSGTPLPKAEALHEAKRWLRQLTEDDARKLTAPAAAFAALRGAVEARGPKRTDERPGRPFSAPFFWAAFVLVGDGG